MVRIFDLFLQFLHRVDVKVDNLPREDTKHLVTIIVRMALQKKWNQNLYTQNPFQKYITQKSKMGVFSKKKSNGSTKK
jgi:hypothetical protein